MVLENSIIETINQDLLNRKVYSERHTREMSMFLYGNHPIALAYMCKVLRQYVSFIKVHKLQVEDVDLTDSYLEYCNKAKATALTSNVSCRIITTNGTRVGVEIKTLNHNIIQEIIETSNLSFIQTSRHTLMVHLTDIHELFTILRNYKLNVANCVKYLKEHSVSDKYFRKADVSTDYVPNKIVLKELSTTTVGVICDELFIPLLKTIRGFTVQKQSKTNSIPKAQLYTFYSLVQNLAIQINMKTDLSDFDKFLNLNIEESNISMQCQCVGDLTLLIMLSGIHPIINNVMISIPTVVLNSDKAFYAFNTRHLETVIEKLENTNIKIDLTPLKTTYQNLLAENNKLATTPIDHKVLGIQRVPWNHQIEGARTLLKRRKQILADDMGIGKTFTSLLASQSIIKQLNGIVLIVCPSSVKYNWYDEIRFIDKTSDIEVVEGKYGSINKAPYIIINYDILKSHLNELIAMKPLALICDEAHRLKGISPQGAPDTERAKSCLQLGSVIPYVFALTGTPTPRSTIDLFNLLRLINCPLSDSYEDFGITYCDGKISSKGYDFSGSSNVEQLNTLLKDYIIRHRKEECLDLPTKLRTFMRTDNVDLVEYRRCVKEYMDARDFNPQVVNLVSVNQMKKFLAYAKTPETFNIARELLENGDNLVIFSSFTKVITDLKIALSHVTNSITGNPIRVGIITGKVSPRKKLQLCKDFNNGLLDCLICNTQAGGEGLNMTRANKMIINDLSWTPSALFQAEDRIHRGGQLRKVEIIYLIAEEAEIDVKLGNVIEERAKNSSILLDGEVTADRDVNVFKGVLKYLEEVQKGTRKNGRFDTDTENFDVVYEARTHSGQIYKGTAVYYSSIERVINISIPQKPCLHSQILEVYKVLTNSKEVSTILPIPIYMTNQQTNQVELMSTQNFDFTTYKFVSENEEEQVDNTFDKCFIALPHGETIWCNTFVGKNKETLAQNTKDLFDSYQRYLAFTQSMKANTLPITDLNGNSHTLNLTNLELAISSVETSFTLPDKTLIDIADKTSLRLRVSDMIYNSLLPNLPNIKAKIIEKATITLHDGRTFEIFPTDNEKQFTVPSLNPSTLIHPSELNSAYAKLELDELEGLEDLELEGNDSTDDGLDLEEPVSEEPLKATDDLELDEPQEEPPLILIRREPQIYQYTEKFDGYNLILKILFVPINEEEGFDVKINLTRLDTITQNPMPISLDKASKLTSIFSKNNEVGNTIFVNLKKIESTLKNNQVSTSRVFAKHFRNFLDKNSYKNPTHLQVDQERK